MAHLPLTKGLSIDDDNPVYHQITTDHPWMNELGLGVFTIDMLYEKWNEKNKAGEFTYRKIFQAGNIEPKVVLGGDDIGGDPF